MTFEEYKFQRISGLIKIRNYVWVATYTHAIMHVENMVFANVSVDVMKTFGMLKLILNYLVFLKYRYGDISTCSHACIHANYECKQHIIIIVGFLNNIRSQEFIFKKKALLKYPKIKYPLELTLLVYI